MPDFRQRLGKYIGGPGLRGDSLNPHLYFCHVFSDVEMKDSDVRCPPMEFRNLEQLESSRIVLEDRRSFPHTDDFSNFFDATLFFM